MSYTNKTLISGEEVLFTTSFSIKVLVINYTFWVTLIAVLPAVVLPDAGIEHFLIGLSVISVFFIKSVISYLTTEYSITNKKVLTKTGLISRDTDELPSAKIEGIDVKQSIIERILNIGNIVVTGTGTQTVVFAGVDNPLQFKKTIQTAL